MAKARGHAKDYCILAKYYILCEVKLSGERPELRGKCKPGEFCLSVRGPIIQVNFGWDFDGDYFMVIELRPTWQMDRP